MIQAVGIKERRGVGILVVALVISILALGVSAFSMTQKPSYNPALQTREFVVVNGDAGFNETAVGISHDTFIPDQIVVNQGDKVIIHFYNTEESEHHTFTIGAPYNINVDLAGGQHQDITFTANQPGVFRFYCVYHVPTMSGELVVWPT